eukprot:CCRYP_020882-RA/>CCRYP_020882-RA protein AED:0.10 eAED:0.10 QI:0/0.6/0.66/1/0.2/0.16/6/1318/488
MKLFDAHNHIHLGLHGLTPIITSSTRMHHPNATFAGAAIMSTHPRDYSAVESVVRELRERSYNAVPCYGVHPWFLNDVITDPEATRVLENGEELWLNELKERLQMHPDAIVGEIGLDGARWVEQDDGYRVNSVVDENIKKQSADKSIWDRKRTLACPMSLQKDAFIKQLLLAAELKRPVSIHVVRAWGELFDSLDEVREKMKQKHEMLRIHASKNSSGILEKQKNMRSKIKEVLLPPKIYFHAFSGKAGILPSLLSACAKGNIDPNSDVYFGFAPAIPNFYAPKTPSIMRQIGLHRLLLETDLEDASCAWEDLLRCLEGVAGALEVDVQEAADQTFKNAESSALALLLFITEGSNSTFAFSFSSSPKGDVLHNICESTQGLGHVAGTADVANSSRRSFLYSTAAAIFASTANCKLIAPKDPQYCQSNCEDYCSQPDRTDGLSGSVSSSGGETGILGTTTVVKGEDKPPQVKIPGLDFTSDKGRKLIGY